MTNWTIRLKGHKFDLADLAERFTTDDARVIQVDQNYYLASNRFSNLSQPIEVRAEALDLLQKINGIMKISHSDFQSVELDAVTEERADGTRQHFVLSEGVISVRARAALSIEGDTSDMEDGRGNALPTEEEQILRLIGGDDRVATALRLYEQQGPTWVNLYRIYEVIGTERVIKRHGWATNRELTRFTRSANHQDVAGDEARHAASKEAAPADPMDLAEADALIKRVLQHWLKWRQSSQSSN